MSPEIVAGTVARGPLVDGMSVSSISTSGGNPLSSAGALAYLRYLLDHDLQGDARAVGARLMRRPGELLGRLAVVGEVRGKGLMIGVELVEPGTRTPAPHAATAVLTAQEADEGAQVLERVDAGLAGAAAAP
jgi:4-aminobutyrate aminotransferase